MRRSGSTERQVGQGDPAFGVGPDEDADQDVDEQRAVGYATLFGDRGNGVTARTFDGELKATAVLILGDASAAEDVWQELHCKAWQLWQRDLAGRSSSDRRGWCRRVLLNDCLRHLRRRAREMPTEIAEHQLPPAGGGWEPIAPQGSPREWAIDIVSPTEWKLVAGRTILATDNAGQSWQTVRSDIPLGSSPASMPDFVTAQVGWYLGEGSEALFRTTDGGSSWRQVTVPGVGSNTN
ncbi:MAG: hypothetical protein ACRD0Z_17330 [Acidimicrobiales bacterium]